MTVGLLQQQFWVESPADQGRCWGTGHLRLRANLVFGRPAGILKCAVLRSHLAQPWKICSHELQAWVKAVKRQSHRQHSCGSQILHGAVASPTAQPTVSRASNGVCRTRPHNLPPGRSIYSTGLHRSRNRPLNQNIAQTKLILRCAAPFQILTEKATHAQHVPHQPLRSSIPSTTKPILDIGLLIFSAPKVIFSTPILPEVIFLTPSLCYFCRPPRYYFFDPSGYFFDPRSVFFDPQLPH